MGASAGIIMQGIGTGVSAMGQYEAGKKTDKLAQENAKAIATGTEMNAALISKGSQRNAEILEWNALLQEAQAADAYERGREAETIFRKQTAALEGSNRASFAAQGVEIDSGSPVDVAMSSAYEAELDALTIRVNAHREAWGYKAEAENLRMQSATTREMGRLEAEATRAAGRADVLSTSAQGKQAKAAGTFGAFSTILGNATSVAMQRYKSKASEPKPAVTNTSRAAKQAAEAKKVQAALMKKIKSGASAPTYR